MSRRTLPCALGFALILSGSPVRARGQPPAPSPEREAEAPVPASGRGRDPFRPPRAAENAVRPPGLEGVRIGEAVIRGVLRFGGSARDGAASGGPESGAGFGYAVLESPLGEAFLGRPGDRLLDGVLHRVEADGVRFLRHGDPGQEVFRALAAAESGR